ncbi:FAD-dependent oxidoreductase [Gynuella sunshinyii]|uniref:2-polyprenyl-6-methoxyphenol hydroxylase and related FAD-dependent oxidoreductase n=1 Tax=Gynuella sunshinyii YC6258 TaxID=1445510 RepID=A0A0C5VLU5_9GAMM|nr:FAD-dependent oxidoreductase [Gynuella sunshinyii]AJQ95692.1 2-polyprenyl-6-methoxyphenol hydroxylase and related FAD-dependent oxidoreductase [Gynuella sunshinyii YC6258]
MSAVNKVLVIGGGFSGMAAAITLARGGIQVDLVENDPYWQPLGAGITINGATLRALQSLGLYDEIGKAGCLTDGVDMHLADGQYLTRLPTPSPEGANVAGSGGILRPILARIMAEATRKEGVSIRLGCSYELVEPHDDCVHVRFTDQTEDDYDLLIGAEGLHSNLRKIFFPEIPEPEYIGQGVWRGLFPRPTSIDRVHMWMGDHLKLGVNPVSDDQMYMFITEDRPTKEHIDTASWPQVFADLMSQFPEPVIADLIPYAFDDGANIDYRPLFNLLVPVPWNRGRILLIGDTVAATTPHMASGAGIGIESGIVLSEELLRTENLDEAMAHFHERRWERCRMVVENSERLARIEIEGGDKRKHSQIMGDTMAELAKPI